MIKNTSLRKIAASEEVGDYLGRFWDWLRKIFSGNWGAVNVKTAIDDKAQGKPSALLNYDNKSNDYEKATKDMAFTAGNKDSHTRLWSTQAGLDRIPSLRTWAAQKKGRKDWTGWNSYDYLDQRLKNIDSKAGWVLQDKALAKALPTIADPQKRMQYLKIIQRAKVNAGQKDKFLGHDYGLKYLEDLKKYVDQADRSMYGALIEELKQGRKTPNQETHVQNMAKGISLANTNTKRPQPVLPRGHYGEGYQGSSIA